MSEEKLSIRFKDFYLEMAAKDVEELELVKDFFLKIISKRGVEKPVAQEEEKSGEEIGSILVRRTGLEHA